ncbi:collagen alpha-3(VI) chain-like isoform X2 [Mytilus californianus]|uniref:collagen alpha-3(VI) chain-like isoform X2 n=1 Tax=Mytilus californianus TaxID=6549 RepID=UPI0022454050|nr:collagen alpha-3(VI) chain-like isoform X2 [Mytilus californianus]
MDIKVWSTCIVFVYFISVNGEQTLMMRGPESKIPPTLACGGVDLVFLVDTSRSIWELDFTRQLDFIERVVGKFDIGPGRKQTRVGVILYAQTFWVRFYLRSHMDLPSLRAAIRRIPHRHGSKTRTEKALRFLRTHMFKKWYGGRSNTTHVAIIISDGRSQDRRATRREATKVKEAGVKLFTIGVGKRADIEELKEIASDPDEHFVFQVGDFKALDGLNYKLPTSTCVAGAISTKTTPPPTTSTTSPATTLPSVLLLQPMTYLTLQEANRASPTLQKGQGQNSTESPKVLWDILTRSPQVERYLTTTSSVIDETISEATNSTAKDEDEIIDQNNIQPGSQDHQRTILLSNEKSEQAFATLPTLQGISTSPDNIHQQISGLFGENSNNTAVQWNGNNEGPFQGQRQTTPLPIEIQKGLAAYSLKPITEDQAQIMSNYVLRDVPAQSYCDGKDADIYFVLDASNSIWPEDFKQQLAFVNSVIDILDVTHGNTRVGVVVYSTTIHPIVMINSGFSKSQIKRQVNAIQYVSGRTNTSDSLRYIRQYGFGPGLTREGAVKLAIVLTDGVSRRPLETKKQSNLCREAGIHLFAVGIGKNVDQTELKRIANDPDQKFMFHVDSHAALSTIKDFLAITACSVAPDQPRNVPVCNDLGPLDVLFSYDSFALGSRKSQMINFFIHDVLNSLNFSNGNLQIGRLTDNCPEITDIPISAGKNLSAFASINYPGVPNLLRKMKSGFSNREGAKKLGVLFVDDSTESIENAVRVIKDGIDYKLMVIGIGDQQVTDSAGDLCSYPKHDYFLQVPRYSNLLRARSKLLDKLCTTMIAAG